MVILGIIALFAAQYVSKAVTAIFDGHELELDQLLTPVDTSAGNENNEDAMGKELEGESFTWLMVVYDKRPEVYENYYPTAEEIEKLEDPGILGKDYKLAEATSIAVVHANVEKREYVTMTVPVITKVETAVGDYTLGQVYGIYGIEYLCEKISSMIGLEVDYYTVMNGEDMPSLASAIGAVECEIPVNIGFNGSEYVTYVEPEDTTAAEAETAAKPAAEDKDKNKDKDKDEDKDKETEAETEPPETEPVVESELEAEKSVKLAKKLHAAILYRDWSDGIEQETAILNSFVNGVLNNISGSSDNALQNIIRGLEKKMETNIIAEDIAKNGDVIRAYTWMNKQTMVYPGRLVSASANKEAFYMPDINEAMEFFYNYR